MKTFDLYFDSLDGLSLRGNGCMAEGEYVRKEDADKLQAKLEAATTALEGGAKGIENIAFDIPAPNSYTPGLVMWANQMRNEYARIKSITEVK